MNGSFLEKRRKRAAGANFLSILCAFITPIAGILIADFYICNRKEYDEDWSNIHKGIKWDALTAWVASSLVGLAMTERPVGFGWFVEFGNIIPVPIVCIFVAVVIYATGQRFKKTASLEARGGMSGRSSINEGEQA